MKRTSKQLLSMLLAIVMVIGLMVPAMAATPIMGEVAETPVVEAETPAAGRPTAKKASATLFADTVHTLDKGVAEVRTWTTDTNLTTGHTFDSGYFSMAEVSSGATWDADTKFDADNSIPYFQVAKSSKKTGISFTTSATKSSVTITFASTGNDKLSAIALANASGELQTIAESTMGRKVCVLQSNDTIAVVNGGGGSATSPAGSTVTYNDLPAGTYIIHSPATAAPLTELPSTVGNDITADALATDSCDPAKQNTRVFSVVVTETGDTGPALDIAVDTVTLKQGDAPVEEITLTEVGATATLTPVVTLKGEDAGKATDADKAVSWTTSAASVATVADGVITAVNAGTATITATSTKDKTKSASVTVKVEISGVSVNSVTLQRNGKDADPAYDMKVGDAIGLTALVDASEGAPASYLDVEWTSNSDAVAVVKDGVVAAFSAGTAKITATSTKDNTKTDSVAITVTANEENVHILESYQLASTVNYGGKIPATTDALATPLVVDDVFTIHWGKQQWSMDGGVSGHFVPGVDGIVDGVNDHYSDWRLKSMNNIDPTKVGTTNPGNEAYIQIKPTTGKKAILEMWFCPNKKTVILSTDLAITDPEATTGVEWGKTYTDNSPVYKSVELDGTATNGYYLYNTTGNISIFKLRLTEVDSLGAPSDLQPLLDKVVAAKLHVDPETATAAAAAAALKKQVESIVKNSAVEVTVTVADADFAAAQAGTLANLTGTPGKADYTVKLATADNQTGVTSEKIDLEIEPPAFVAVTSVTVSAADNKTSVEASPLKTLQLSAAVQPSNATIKDVEWSVATADQVYLTVNKDGIVKGVKASDGRKITVTATAADGSGVTGTIELEVVPAVVSEDDLKPVNDGEDHIFNFASLANVDGDTYLTSEEKAQIKKAGFEVYENQAGAVEGVPPKTPKDDYGFMFKRKGPYIQLSKDMKTGFKFIVDGSAEHERVNLSVKFASTGGSNTSAAALVKDPDGTKTVVREDEGQTTVTGTAYTTFTYTGLTGGVYLICNNDFGAYGRGTRISSVEVVPTSAEDVIPEAQVKDFDTEVVKYAKVDFVYDATKFDPSIVAKVTNVKVGTVDVKDEEGSQVNKFDQYADSVTAELYKDGAKTKISANQTDCNAVMDEADPFKVNSWAPFDLALTPDASGTYTVKVTATQGAKTEVWESNAIDFVLPLGEPRITKGQCAGDCKVDLEWEAVKEATGYVVEYVEKGAEGATPVSEDMGTELKLTLTKDELGKYEGKVLTFTVYAVRTVGDKTDRTPYSMNIKITTDAQRVWNFSTFGESTSKDANYFEGNLNADGKVKIYSTDGAGKMLPATADGIAVYYTAIPAGNNYTITADVHVDRWVNRSSQNGVGVIAMDRVKATSDTTRPKTKFWNNSYVAGALKFPYLYDADNNAYYDADEKGASGTKYNYYIGLGAISRYGVTIEEKENTDTPTNFFTRSFPLDTRLARDGVKNTGYSSSNQFNLIGNYKDADPAGQSVEKYMLTDFRLEVKKSNTGYTMTWYDIKTGEKMGSDTMYYAKGARELSGATTIHTDLDKTGAVQLAPMDQAFEYVGLFTSRDMDATFSNVKVTEIAQADDKTPPEDPPVKKITPVMNIISGSSSNTTGYTLMFTSNVDGTADIMFNRSKLTTVGVTDGVRTDVDLTLKNGINSVEVVFHPDPDQDLGAFTALTSSAEIKKSIVVKYEQFFQNRQNIYVSPNGRPTGYGTMDSPLDVYSAVGVARPGQNIVLLGGTYNLTKEIRINRGMNGEEGKPIYFMAQPGEKVILNGKGNANNVLLHASDWWVFKDFEVVNAGNNKAGIQLCGHHNIVQNVKLHDNGGTGLQISRLSDSDRPWTEGAAEGTYDWPSYNTIVNCDAYRNYDQGYSDADGFGAKLTVGPGNVFDGCASFWNADDGWDLYAKAETGSIAPVTIKNSIAFENGYEVRKLVGDGTQTPVLTDDGYTPELNIVNGKLVLASAGDGNGFKMGGSNMAGAHKNINSLAFYNKTKGFDSNSGPDIHVVNGTAYNNGAGNISLESGNKKLAFVVDGLISFKDTGAASKDGDTVPDSNANPLEKETNYYWNGRKSLNSAGAKVDATSFVSTTWDNLTWFNDGNFRKDGILDLGDFLKKSDKAPADAGAPVLGNDTETEVPGVPESVTNPPDSEIGGGSGSGGSGGGGGAGGGGTVGTTPTVPDDKPGTTTTPEKVFTANKTTDDEGNTEIVVKAEDGEIVADVKIPAAIPAPETKFDDVPEDHWAEESINNMAALGVVKGIGDNKYDMNTAVTRGTIATMLYRFANGKEGKTNPFTDVAGGQWYTDAIAWAADSGVVTGYSETTFGPNDTITREQLAVMLWRFAKLIGMDGAASSSSLESYNDVNAVNTWAEDGMAWCVQNGIINGVSSDTLSPSTSATRAQTATMLNRFIALMK